MDIASFFPKEIMDNNSSEFTLETIASKFTFFEIQLHLLHWQTTSIAEHQALGTVYESMLSYKDDVIEKLMGYTGRRIKGFKLEPITDYSPGKPLQIASDLDVFAKKLQVFAKSNSYPDIENISQTISGEAVKLKYLLTLT